ncbi:MAG: SusC/RagA family TonB-linked outer membrane protein [Bacteroidaceae bacterium]|nr:SusC/RagA family TonB-linked outer membrane protein [Bacteroidaceae bacterium]
MKKNNIIIASLLVLSVAPMSTPAFSFVPQVTQEEQEVRVLKGVVYDECKQPLGDVVVTSGGKTARTNADGQFELKEVKANADITVWADGFYSQTLPVNGRTSLSVYMISKAKYGYNESVVLPMSPVKDEAIHEAGNYNLNKQNLALGSMSIDNALKGELSGLQVTNKSGMTGEGAYLNLHGIRSLLAENSPLIVINGVPYLPNKNESSMISGFSRSIFQAYNVQDIQNITVLTGADASLYGSLGSNGVILIETDGATSDDMNTKISYSGLFGVNYNDSRLPLMNAKQYKSYLSDMGMTYYDNMETFFSNFPFLQDPNCAYNYLYNKNTDWQDEIYRTSMSHDHLFRVEGGDAIAKYDISLGYTRDEGILKNTNSDRYNIQINTNVLVSKEFEIVASVGMAYLTGQYQPQGLSLENNPLLAAYRRTPLLSPYNSDMNGNLLDSYSSYYFGMNKGTDFIVSNPLSIVNTLSAKNHQFDVNGKVQLSYKPNPYFSANAVVGMYYNYNKEETFVPGINNMDIVPVFDQYGSADNKVLVGAAEVFNFFSNLNVAYKRKFGSNQFNARLGAQVLTTKSEYDAGSSRNTPNDFYQNLGNTTTSIGRYIVGYNNAWNWMSYYLHADYTMNNLVKVGANLSFDGASSTGKDATRMGFFPSANVMLMAKNFKFLQDVDFINKLDLYADYGLTGNSQYSSKLGKYYYVSSSFQGISGLVRANVPNTNLEWEKDLNLSAGLNASLFYNRLNLGVKYFNTQATDVLMISPKSSAYGTAYYYSNDGEISSNGIDLSLSFTPIKTRNFEWTLGGNLSTYTNEVESLGKVNEAILTLGDDAEVITRVGENPYSFYGYKSLGIFSTTEEAELANLKNKNGVAFAAGDVHYQDVNHDGIINNADKQVIGSATPDYFGSFYNHLQYKGFGLDLTFVYSVGNEAYNAVRRVTESASDFSNQSKAVIRRWNMEGQMTDMPRAQWNDVVGNNDFSDRWIEDASYLKLRDITFSYTFNKPVWNFFQGGTLYVTGQNLLNFTKYLGLDPEFSYSYSESMQGVDYGKVVSPKSVKVGVNLKF